jgi:Cobalamin-5-phosphate synthase
MIDNTIIQQRGHGSGNADISSDTIHQEIHDFLYPKEQTMTLYLMICREIRCLWTILTFLTRLPGPTYVNHHPGYLMMGMTYFPMIGTLIGIWISLFYIVCDVGFQFPTCITSILSITSSLWLTGCFHEDGVRVLCFLFYCCFEYLLFRLF